MTSKERVMTSVAHQEPDRCPIQLYASQEIYGALSIYFGGRSVEEALEVDFRTVAPEGGPVVRVPEPGSGLEKYDEWGTGYVRVPNSVGGSHLEAVDLPLAGMQTMDEVQAYPWPDPAHFDYSHIPEEIKRVRDYAVCVGASRIPDIINGIGRCRGMEQVLVDIAAEDEVGIAIIDARVDYYYEYCKRCLEAGQGKIDILHLGEDLGSQIGPTMSPACFDSFFRPKLKKFIDLAHDHGALAMLHSCGSTRLLQPSLIDMGLDILDAVQPEPVGMDPEGLKRDFGSRLTYCGMISTQHTLPYASIDECRREARHRLDVIGKNGGYIFSPAHNIQPDAPLANVLAIYEEATGKTLMPMDMNEPIVSIERELSANIS